MDDTLFDRLVNIRDYSDAELRELARQLSEEEQEISRRRRLLHGEIDIVRAEMVRRLRDKYGAGEDILKDGDIKALTEILSGRKAGEPCVDEDEGQPEPPGKREATSPPGGQRAIQERFRDLSANVREERLIRYLVKQLGEGRRLDDIMADEYIVTHTNETTRAALLQNSCVLRAVAESIKKQFAGYESPGKPRTDGSKSDQ